MLVSRRQQKLDWVSNFSLQPSFLAFANSANLRAALGTPKTSYVQPEALASGKDYKQHCVEDVFLVGASR